MHLDIFRLIKIFIQTSGMGDNLDYYSWSLIYHYQWTSFQANSYSDKDKGQHLLKISPFYLVLDTQWLSTRSHHSFSTSSTEPPKSISRKNLMPIIHTVLWIYITVLSSLRILNPWVPPVRSEILFKGFVASEKGCTRFPERLPQSLQVQYNGKLVVSALVLK